ncbi:MAG: glutathione binding-like protein [Halieaceae bacterium]
MQYLGVEEAISAPGLRVVLTASVPGPWGEAVKALLAYKGIEFAPVAQVGGGANEALQAWTGQSSAPVLVLDDNPPVSHWLDQLHFIERLKGEKPLLPADMAARAEVLGLSALLAGADGIGWNRRLQLFAPTMAMDEVPEQVQRMSKKYGYTDVQAERASSKLQAQLGHLDNVMAAQERAGKDYLVGDSVTAADFYLAHFAGLIKPLGPKDNPMPDWLRVQYESADEATKDAFTPRLIALRDRMFERHITLPLEF